MSIEFKQKDLILKSGDKPENYFYIITEGKVVSYNNFYEQYKFYSKKGYIIGLVSAVIKEAHFETIEAVEDTEVIKINIDSIVNINNKNLINKIYKHLYLVLETWLSKYYTILAKNKVDLYNKDSILIIANIYLNNGFQDAAYKICRDYIQLFPENKDIEEAKKLLKDIKPIEEPQLIDKNVYKFKKGYCLYSELNTSDLIYMVKSGKVAIYSIVNSKQTMRIIYSSNYFINGYKPILEYAPLLTTAIVLEDSVIEIMNKEELLTKLDMDKNLRLNLIKIISIKINNAVLKIKAINAKDIKSKLIIIIYSIIKIEQLFNDSTSITLSYNIDNIKNMLNLEIDLDEIYTELKTIKYIKFNKNSDTIDVTNTIKYIKEYENYIK
ncbi:cyclic nucleotide-binding domain-containing protein [Brachyspira alvinipulli]|uniref:cyclic nucleotide-binding domain-containing protein n=1 Tax=Brachyspira alvinipulli TaxID=84379 RepID=UPI00048A26E5|nr:cyclic nucleotide-binding domain-containing protein [Brachyspira alvinipulli]